MGGMTDLAPVETGYKNVLRVRLAIVWLVLSGAGLLVHRALHDPGGPSLALPIATLIIGCLVVAIAPQRIYDRLRYGVGDRFLEVARGWLFHSDTVVPLVRVQHLDVVRGPLDKLFGTARLVLHTAGTHNSTVTVPGLAPERAAAMRDTIREHVRSDFA